MVLTINQRFATEVAAMLERDFDDTFEIDRDEYRSAPVWRKVTMHIARLFAPIL
jgi:cardiolipin synthase